MRGLHFHRFCRCCFCCRAYECKRCFRDFEFIEISGGSLSCVSVEHLPHIVILPSLLHTPLQLLSCEAKNCSDPDKTNRDIANVSCIFRLPSLFSSTSTSFYPLIYGFCPFFWFFLIDLSCLRSFSLVRIIQFDGPAHFGQIILSQFHHASVWLFVFVRMFVNEAKSITLVCLVSGAI